MSASYRDVVESLRAYYNSDADHRETRNKSNWKLDERDLFLSWLTREKSRSLLEVGAGTGADSLFFKRAGIEVIATDLSPRMIELCKEKGLDAYVMDFLSIDFGERTFDALYGVNCLLHVPRENLASVLTRFSGLLAPDGLIYLGMYGGRNEAVSREGPFGERLFVSYSDDALQEAISRHFSIERFNRIDLKEGEFPECFQSIIGRNA